MTMFHTRRSDRPRSDRMWRRNRRLPPGDPLEAHLVRHERRYAAALRRLTLTDPNQAHQARVLDTFRAPDGRGDGMRRLQHGEAAVFEDGITPALYGTCGVLSGGSLGPYLLTHLPGGLGPFAAAMAIWLGYEVARHGFGITYAVIGGTRAHRLLDQSRPKGRYLDLDGLVQDLAAIARAPRLNAAALASFIRELQTLAGAESAPRVLRALSLEVPGELLPVPSELEPLERS